MMVHDRGTPIIVLLITMTLPVLHTMQALPALRLWS